jgi:hypothetical protein
MLDVLDDLLAAATARHARGFELRVLVTDPHGSLAKMRRPGLIVARDGDPEHPLGYLALPREGEHRLVLPRAELGHGARVGWYLVHDLLEPMGIVDMDCFRNSALQAVDSDGWREMPAALHLRMPEFAPVARPRNILLANRGLPTPDGLHPRDPADVLRHYRELLEREAGEHHGAIGAGTLAERISDRATSARRERYGAFVSLEGPR